MLFPVALREEVEAKEEEKHHHSSFDAVYDRNDAGIGGKVIPRLTNDSLVGEHNADSDVKCNIGNESHNVHDDQTSAFHTGAMNVFGSLDTPQSYNKCQTTDDNCNYVVGGKVVLQIAIVDACADSS